MAAGSGEMSTTEPRQRLVAILVADVAGYSRLMSQDEHATVVALDRSRTIFKATVESHHGRVVDMAGDSVLAIFDAAVAAVMAAVAIQAQLGDLVRNVPIDRRMQFRIGVHLGDVIEKIDGSVYGEGVNIAARLQSLAEPGGITISESVHGAVKNKASASFLDGGLQHVKNIPDPVRIYRLALAQSPSNVTPRDTDRAPALPDKPSIVVLPFTNMSGDPTQDYVADGIVEDITTELSRFHHLFVIARNTAFTYKGQHVDVKSVARQLGVHFVLEGSVRIAGTRIRIVTQLIDGQTGRHVWAERYEDVLTDVFDVQERITRQVVANLVPEIEEAEMRLLEAGKRWFTEADQLSWQARKALNDAQFSGDARLTDDAIRLAQEAIRHDRTCALAWSVLSSTHSTRVFFGWTEDRVASVQTARRAADTLIGLVPGDSWSYLIRALVGLVTADTAGATADLRRAHELNPNDARVLFFLAWSEAAAGNSDRAKELAAQALRLSPKDRWIGIAHLARAIAAFNEGDLPALREWAELAIRSHPTAPIRRVLMIAYAVDAGDRRLLRTHLDKLESFAPDFIPSMLLGDYQPFGSDREMRRLLDTLRRALEQAAENS
jgi:adenylate cyclase